ncbi:PREDICTED: piriformospora indica-insensitive protein 2 [Tarenaya hassleriana]|uniref:piriformospora indica-insensitive protein 2 n=1 Tax=Tarenaya hassleriana TaxID=28532 RepID=UPI00053C4242|nr:PREDICTED: piriformospora indica-insensitive protein 2 [Tarenaya hassleriana]
MAITRISHSSSDIILILAFMSIIVFTQQQQQDSTPPLALDPSEQEALYRVLESVNSAIPWRTIFPDDLCSSAPDGVVCDFFSSENGVVTSVHVTELSFGYVSDYSPNPPCSSNSTLDPLLFTAFKHLRKLFFYKCFTGSRVPAPGTMPEGFGFSLEEMVFMENPGLVGELGGMIGNFTKLRRLVLTGNGLYGSIPSQIGDLVSLQEITLSRNSLSGRVPGNLTRLKNLKVLDLSHNFFDGNAPASIGDLVELLKLDLSFNGFSSEIPSGVGNLKRIEFLDLSYNRFSNSGVPLFLGDMPRLKEIHLSGNRLGGRIPEIWRNLGAVLGIGFSGMRLEGKIPASMAANLRNLSYLLLDNNRLEGQVPQEFGLLEFAGEINLENNNLSGTVLFPDGFTGRIGKKLRLGGNPDLCVDRGTKIDSQDLKFCPRRDNELVSALSRDGLSSSPISAAFRSAYSSRMLVAMVLYVFFVGRD